MLTNTSVEPGGTKTAVHQLTADVHRRVADVGVFQRCRPEPERTPQQNGQTPADFLAEVAARIGARGRSADSRRAVLPLRVTATIAWAAPCSVERHGRLADGLGVARFVLERAEPPWPDRVPESIRRP